MLIYQASGVRMAALVIMAVVAASACHLWADETVGKAADSNEVQPSATMRHRSAFEVDGITFRNMRKVQLLGSGKGFIGLVHFTSDAQEGEGFNAKGKSLGKRLVPDTGWFTEATEKLSPDVKSGFRVKGTFELLALIRGKAPKMGHVSRDIDGMENPDLQCGSSWVHERAMSHGLYPLASAMQSRAIYGKSGCVGFKQATEASFLLVHSDNAPKEVLDCEFVGSFSKDELGKVEEAIRLTVAKLPGMKAAELRGFLSNENPGIGMVALEQLKANREIAVADYVKLLLAVPKADVAEVFWELARVYLRKDNASTISEELVNQLGEATAQKRKDVFGLIETELTRDNSSGGMLLLKMVRKGIAEQKQGPTTSESQ